MSVDNQRRPTIRDVAAEANVSISTVSLYLGGDARVSEETGHRIAAAVAKLGYVPRARHAPRRGRSLMALVMEALSPAAFPEAFYGTLLRSVEAGAKRRGYSMVLSFTAEGQPPPAVHDEGVQGVIILGGSPGNDALAQELAGRAVPLVLVDNYLPGLALDAVVPDNEWGGYCAFRHLVELGHRRIGLIAGPAKYRTLTDRWWGALRAADELGLSLPPELLQPSISSGYPKKGYREMMRLLALPEPPTAVFAVSDRAALGALEAIKEAGLRVPEDISLIGFDDEAYAAHAVPPLTTVHYPRERIGELAIERLLELVNRDGGVPARISVYTELVVRASTAPARTAPHEPASVTRLPARSVRRLSDHAVTDTLSDSH